jgi:hypothetical protein
MRVFDRRAFLQNGHSSEFQDTERLAVEPMTRLAKYDGDRGFRAADEWAHYLCPKSAAINAGAIDSSSQLLSCPALGKRSSDHRSRKVRAT